MELKLQMLGQCTGRHLFQLHLYGIETTLYELMKDYPEWFQLHLYGIETLQFTWTGRGRIKSSNCTFMELKHTIDKNIFGNGAFQLHLYGIETTAYIANYQDEHGVPIAPLWNWNWNTYQFLRSLIVFQLHLYGIETKKGIIDESGCARFQLHLYGIETLLTSIPISVISVPIAPLWNWNAETIFE